MSRRRKRRVFRQIVNCDLELRPLMNVFIVLIPMLLMSAVFLEIRVIEMTLPRAAIADEATPPAPPFDLAIRIRADAYVVEADGTQLAVIPRTADAAGRAAPDADAAQRISAALASAGASHPDNHEVRIVAEPGTRYREIVAVMDLARAAGLPQAALEGAESGSL